MTSSIKAEKKLWRGTWSSNSGNTWSDYIYTSKTRLGLLRQMSAIIDGNLTGPNDIGKLRVYSPDDPILEVVGYNDLPHEILIRTWYSRRWYRDTDRYINRY